jgi:sn-glycerol 3-phosphate transport system ATP-binding protein
MAELSFRDVRKSYAGLEVIHGVSMEVHDGEFVVIVGPSGCGKSTLLRMVAGLEQITSGEIRIGARVVNELEPKDRDIAMVFQNYALYPHMSVYDNMSYGLRIKGFSRQEIETRVQKAATILELTPFLQRKPRQLSGGQRQRVAMGRAIVREPAVFLFDEPLSNLDAKLRVQMRAELQSLHRRLATTSLYVTHDQVEAMTLAHRMIVMNAGRAEQIGAPLEVYAKPATTFVAAFIGSPPMNLIPQERDGRKLFFGIRPEHLEPCAESDAQLVANIDLIEPLGADTLVYGHLGTNGTRIAARLHSSVDARAGKLPLRYRPEQAHYFDAQSGARISLESGV